MKRKLLSVTMSILTAGVMLSGCGQTANSGYEQQTTDDSQQTADTQDAGSDTADAPADSTDSADATGTDATDNATEAGWPVALSDFSGNPAAPDWAEYDKLIAEIKSTTDFADREAKMHRAEEILMSTGAVVPIYYYNDIYMQRSSIDGIYSSLFGTKYFMHATGAPNNVLSLNLASEPAYLDPALNSAVDGACLAANSFAGLYTYNDKGECVPQLADEANPYEVSDDGLSYTFHLKSDLKWSDGSPLTAADFEYSWKRAADPNTGADYSYMFGGFEGYDAGEITVAATDDTTLTFKLTAPCAYILDLMAFPTFYPVPQAAVEAANTDGTTPGAWASEAGFVSSGAFTLKTWEHDTRMVYVKNPNYYDADNVTVDELDFMLSADDTAIYAAYQAGDIDFADTVPTDEIAALLESKDPEFHIIDNLGTYYVAFNVNSSMFEGKTAQQAADMRRALGLLIDRGYIVDTVGQTGQQVATSYIPAGMLDGNGGVFKENDSDYTYPDQDSAGYYPQEYTDALVDEARELLKGAGFEFKDDGTLADSTPISINYLTNNGSGHIKVAEAIQQDFAVLGIDMTIQSEEWNVFLDDRKAGNYDVAREGWLADFNDPINMLEMFTTDSGNNDCQFGRNPK